MRRCWGWIATRSFTPNREAPAPLGSSSGLPAACRSVSLMRVCQPGPGRRGSRSVREGSYGRQAPCRA